MWGTSYLIIEVFLMHIFYISIHTGAHTHVYINFSLFAGTELFPFFFSLFDLPPSYSICFFLFIFLFLLRIHHPPQTFLCFRSLFFIIPQTLLPLSKNPDRLKNNNGWPQECTTKIYRDSSSLHCKMCLYGS